jgi:hypothetical protein
MGGAGVVDRAHALPPEPTEETRMARLHGRVEAQRAQLGRHGTGGADQRGADVAPLGADPGLAGQSAAPPVTQRLSTGLARMHPHPAQDVAIETDRHQDASRAVGVGVVEVAATEQPLAFDKLASPQTPVGIEVSWIICGEDEERLGGLQGLWSGSRSAQQLDDVDRHRIQPPAC